MDVMDKLHEECGVFGIFRQVGEGVVAETYHALYALQHRGQESCGIAVNNDGVISCYKDVGLVTEVFTRDALEKMEEYHLDFRRVRAVASIDLKKEEKGLIDFCRKYDLAFEIYSKEELLLAKGNFVSSDFVKGVTGVDNVCERSAVVFAQEDDSCLIVHKQKGGSVTLAVAQKTATCHF